MAKLKGIVEKSNEISDISRNVEIWRVYTLKRYSVDWIWFSKCEVIGEIPVLRKAENRTSTEMKMSKVSTAKQW